MGLGSRSLEEHEQHLREVFTRLRENCLTVNIKKCVLAKSTVTFLGHTVDSEGIRPLPEKVDAIKQTSPCPSPPTPQTPPSTESSINTIEGGSSHSPSSAV